MDHKHLAQVVKRIHKELTAREKEYARKNITHRLREDWGYAFYTGKLVAYLYILKAAGYVLRGDQSFVARIKRYK